MAPGYVRTEMTARLEQEGRLDFKAVAATTDHRDTRDMHEGGGIEA